MIGDVFEELEQDECVCRVDAAGAIDAGQSQAGRKSWDVSDYLQEPCPSLHGLTWQRAVRLCSQSGEVRQAPPAPNGEADVEFVRIKKIAEASGARNILQRSGSADSIAQAIVKESERGYDAIFAGASPIEGDYALGGEVLRELVDNVEAPIIIVRNVGASMPLRRILAPTTGAPFSRLGATLAMLYAHETDASVTALHIKEGPTLPVLRDLYRRRNTVEEAWRFVQPILDAWEQSPMDPPIYAAGSWGPLEAALMIAADGRTWRTL